MTGTVDLTITDFLLARLAEDEALLATPTARRMVGRRMVEEPIERLPEYLVRDRERWAAECRAKRAIVDECERSMLNDWDSSTAEWIAAQLAAVYASHPDYDPAWEVER